MEQKANVHIIATGGSVPGLDKLANLSGEQLCNIDSKDMQETIWLQLAERVEAAAERNDVDGIVITHGTDTLEETAYFLQLTVKTDKPIVLTGAMNASGYGHQRGRSDEHLAVCAGGGRSERNRAWRAGGDERADQRGGNRYKSQRQCPGSVPVSGKGTDGRYRGRKDFLAVSGYCRRINCEQIKIYHKESHAAS